MTLVLVLLGAATIGSIIAIFDLNQAVNHLNDAVRSLTEARQPPE